MILTVLRISLLLLSLGGYSLMLQHKLRLYTKSSWLAACCLMVLCLNVAGYFGMLYPVAWAQFGVGLLLGAFYLRADYRAGKWHRPQFRLLYIWLLLYFMVFIGTLLHSHLVHYDNYSYWATIVKYLFTQGTIPDASTTLIEFTSYPMGSSLFVYYATVIVGFGDNVMLIGQFLLIFACVYGMFAIMRDESNLLLMMVMFSVISAFNHYNIAIRMNNLLVDFILPMMTLAGLAGLHRMQRDLRAISGYVFLVAAALALVKNSALFFVVILFGYYVTRVFRYHQRTVSDVLHRVGVVLGTIVATLLPIVVWTIHVKITFTASKHEVNLAAYSDIYGAKDASIIQQISDRFVAEITNVATLSTQGIVLLQAVIIGVFLLVRFGMRKRTRLLRYLLLIDAIIAVYYAGIYAMFLFSMPIEEALYLAGFERYASSIVIFALGVGAMVIVREIDRLFFEPAGDGHHFKNTVTKKVYQYTSILLLFYATLLLLSENNGMAYHNQQYASTIPARLERVAGNTMMLNDARYLVVTVDKQDVDNYFVQVAGRYFLYATEVDGREDFVMDATDFIDLLSQYDKVVVLDDHFTFNAMTELVFQRTLEPGVYTTQELLSALPAE